MRPVQRIGFTVFSLMFLLFGTGLLVGAIDFFREESPAFIFLGIPSLGLLFVAVLGLRNVLRFPTSAQTNDADD